MKRLLFNLVAGGSLLLLVVTVLMWVRSYWVPEDVLWLRDTPGNTQWIRRIYGGTSTHGVVLLMYDRPHSSNQSPDTIRAYREDAAIQPTIQHTRLPANWTPVITHRYRQHSLLGLLKSIHIGFNGIRDRRDNRSYEVVFPYWLLAVTLIVPVVIWLRSKLKVHSQIQKGHCAKCGYDLRATLERCPECGAVPEIRVNK